MVGAVFIAIAALLEGLQAFTPERSAYLPAALYGAGGTLMAAFITELFIRAWRRRKPINQAVFRAEPAIS